MNELINSFQELSQTDQEEVVKILSMLEFKKRLLSNKERSLSTMSKSTYNKIDSMTISESERKSKPTSSDYKEAKKLLKDFQIRCKMPEFDTKAELEHYTRMRIKNKLCGVKRT